MHSSGDWLAPQTGISDMFKDLRHAIVKIVSKYRPHKAARLSCRTSTMTISWRRRNVFCSQQDSTQICPFIPTRSFACKLIRNLLQLMHDPDIGLIGIAESGFHTGASKPILFSGIWRRHQTEAREDLPLKIHDTNWKSAEKDPDTVSRVIQEHIDAKFAHEFYGDIAQAKQRWPKGVAVGRLSVARSDQRAPSLCLDSTIPDVNAKVQNEEKSFNPCVEDVASAKVVSHPSEGIGLTIDVSKAHKSFRTREDEWGLLLFHHRGELLPLHSLPLWGSIQRCLVEPHESSAHTHLPPVPFHSARSMTVRR